MMQKRLKYKQYLAAFPDCPTHDFVEVNRAAYRWTHKPLEINDFTPLNLFKPPPARMLDDTDKIQMCMGYGLSMFDSLKNSILRYQPIYKKLRPNSKTQFKQDKGAYVALVFLSENDGVANIPSENGYGHFTFHEYLEANLEAQIFAFYPIFKENGEFNM